MKLDLNEFSHISIHGQQVTATADGCGCCGESYDVPSEEQQAYIEAHIENLQNEIAELQAFLKGKQGK